MREPVHVPDLEPLSNSTKVDARQTATEKTGVSGSTASKTKMMVQSGEHAFLARADSSAGSDADTTLFKFEQGQIVAATPGTGQGEKVSQSWDTFSETEHEFHDQDSPGRDSFHCEKVLHELNTFSVVPRSDPFGTITRDCRLGKRTTRFFSVVGDGEEDDPGAAPSPCPCRVAANRPPRCLNGSRSRMRDQACPRRPGGEYVVHALRHALARALTLVAVHQDLQCPGNGPFTILHSVPTGQRQFASVAKGHRPASMTVKHDVAGEFDQESPPPTASAAAVAAVLSHVSSPYSTLSSVTSYRLLPRVFDSPRLRCHLFMRTRVPFRFELSITPDDYSNDTRCSEGELVPFHRHRDRRSSRRTLPIRLPCPVADGRHDSHLRDRIGKGKEMSAG